jgi:flagellin-like protein
MRYRFLPRLGQRLSDLAHKENGEVNIVAIVVLIGVAIVLAVVFKKQAKTLIETLFSKLGDKANDAWSEIT